MRVTKASPPGSRTADPELLAAAWRRTCQRRTAASASLRAAATRAGLGLMEADEESQAALPDRLRNSLVVRGATRALQLACVLYGTALIYWVWLAKGFSVGFLVQDPVFHLYSILVTLYVLSRFLMAPLYRPTPDTGYRPMASIVIPAFNEEGCIEATIDACYASDYPVDKLEVVVVDDGSTDSTWQRILAARRRHPSLLCVRFASNCGKRAAMAEGIRRSSGEVSVFIDSDSVVARDGLLHLMADFRDPRVGAVVGRADVLNKTKTVLTKMQQVRYYVAFQVIKGSESLFGAVTCASGCFSAYRRKALIAVLERWEKQTFLGAKATFGDDRALTNYVLRDHRVVYQALARSYTLAPETLRDFLIQQLRWKKSWLRESWHVASFIWRKHPIAAASTCFGVLFPWIAPLVILHAVVWNSVAFGDPWMYLVGAYAMALIYSLYYAVTRRSPLWYHGLTFVVIYMSLLVWQTYYALLTIRNTRWGTRASVHGDTKGEVTVVPSRTAAATVGSA
jgi:hyaluronan synthase